jgi:hypothetical protein
MAGKNQPSATAEAPDGAEKSTRISQEDVPAYSLDQALRVPHAIADNYAYKPTRPLNVAGAMKVSPSSGPFRMLAGASIAYGLTTGGAYAPEIGITPLGLRIVRPTVEGDDRAAKREALLRPKIIGDFLRQYDGAALPGDSIARNVLIEKGVPPTRIDDVFLLIVESAEAVGFIKDINGKKYVDLAGTDLAPPTPAPSTPADVAPHAIAGAQVAAPMAPAAMVSPGVHINLEIHIAADASAQTIEEIFKNMRRYVLTNDGASDQQ